MQNNTPYTNLKIAIEAAEKKQLAGRHALQQEFKTTIDNLKPLNLLKNSIKKFTDSTETGNSLLTFMLPIAFGFLSKRAFSGARTANVAKQFGIVLIDGLNNYVNQNPEVINSISKFILNLFRKKKSSAGQEAE
jgi:hypothetical protein